MHSVSNSHRDHNDTTLIWHVTSFVNCDNFMVLICAIRFYLNDN